MIHRLCFLLPFFALLLLFVGCESIKSTSASRSTKPATPNRMVIPENPISSIAGREIVRRQERIRSADEAAIRAGQRSASGDLEGARAGYSKALATLPE